MYLIRRWLYLIPLVFLALPVQSAVVIEAVKTGSGVYTSNGNIRMPFTFEGATPNTPVTYTKSSPVISKGLVPAIAKKAVRGGFAGLAINGVVEGLGFLIDKAISTPQIKKAEQKVVGGNVYASGTNRNCHLNECPASNVYDALASCNAVHGNCVLWTGEETWDGDLPYKVYYNPETEEVLVDLNESEWKQVDDAFNSVSPSQATSIISSYLQQTGMPNVKLDAPGLPAPESVTKRELQAILDGAPYPVIGQSAATQELLAMWPELMTAMQQLANIKLAQQVTQMHSELSLTPEQQAVLDNSELTLPDTQQNITVEVPSLDLPPFCEWASFICEPFVGGEHPPLPINQIEIPEYDSGLPSAGQCPEPVAFELSIWGSHEISFQPACDLAEAIKLPLQAISYLLAGYIVVGVRR